MNDDEFTHAVTIAKFRCEDASSYLERAITRVTKRNDRQAAVTELLKAKEYLARSREFIDAAIEALT